MLVCPNGLISSNKSLRALATKPWSPKHNGTSVNTRVCAYPSSFFFFFWVFLIVETRLTLAIYHTHARSTLTHTDLNDRLWLVVHSTSLAEYCLRSFGKLSNSSKHQQPCQQQQIFNTNIQTNKQLVTRHRKKRLLLRGSYKYDSASNAFIRSSSIFIFILLHHSS